jgi:hypothetical protein
MATQRVEASVFHLEGLLVDIAAEIVPQQVDQQRHLQQLLIMLGKEHLNKLPSHKEVAALDAGIEWRTWKTG